VTSSSESTAAFWLRQAGQDAILDPLVEVDDDLDLLGPLRDHVAEAAGHGQEGAQHEQADGDRAHRDRVHQAAPPQAGARLREEILERSEPRHGGRGL
jgi:hypothetical protein